MPRKRLVLAAVGDDSVHPAWLSEPSIRTFDVCLIYFGNQANRYQSDADIYFERKGLKFPMIHALAQQPLAEVLPTYDYIWLPDDDIIASTNDINRLFDVATEHEFMICQPSIGKGDMSYNSLRTCSEFLLRFSKYVEVMCPLFHRDAFAKVLPLFIENRSAWGIDWLWSSLFEEHQIAVIDAVSVVHNRPLKTGEIYSRLKEMGVDPYEDHAEIVQKYNLDIQAFHKASCQGYARLQGIRLDGKKQWTRPLWTNLLTKRTLRKFFANESGSRRS